LPGTRQRKLFHGRREPARRCTEGSGVRPPTKGDRDSFTRAGHTDVRQHSHPRVGHRQFVWCFKKGQILFWFLQLGRAIRVPPWCGMVSRVDKEPCGAVTEQRPDPRQSGPRISAAAVPQIHNPTDGARDVAFPKCFLNSCRRRGRCDLNPDVPDTRRNRRCNQGRGSALTRGLRRRLRTKNILTRHGHVIAVFVAE
jgi:hypothetical protein